MIYPNRIIQKRSSMFKMAAKIQTFILAVVVLESCLRWEYDAEQARKPHRSYYANSKL